MALSRLPTLLPLPAPPPTAVAGSSTAATGAECELHLWGVTSYDLSALLRRRRRGRRDKKTTARNDPDIGSQSDDSDSSRYARGSALEEDLPADDTVSRLLDLLALLLAILTTLLGVQCGRESLAGAVRWCRGHLPRLADGFRRMGRLAAAALRRAAWQLPQALAGRAALAVWAGRGPWDGAREDRHGTAAGGAAAGAASSSCGGVGAGGRGGALEQEEGFGLSAAGPGQQPLSTAELASGSAAPAMPSASPAPGPRPGPRLRDIPGTADPYGPLLISTPGPTFAPKAAHTPNPAASDTSLSDLETWAASASTSASASAPAPAASTPAPGPASAAAPTPSASASTSTPISTFASASASAPAAPAPAASTLTSGRRSARATSSAAAAVAVPSSAAAAAHAAAEAAAAAASYNSAVVGPVHPRAHAHPQTQPYAQQQLRPRATRAAPALGVTGRRPSGIASGRGSSLYRSTVHSLRLSLKVLTPREQRQQRQARSTSGSESATREAAGGASSADSGRDSEVESPARPRPDVPQTPTPAQAAQAAQEQMVASLAVAAVQAKIEALQRQHHLAAAAAAAVAYNPAPLPPAAAAARAAAAFSARAHALDEGARRAAHGSAEAPLTLAPATTAPTSSLSSCGLPPSLAAGIAAATPTSSSFDALNTTSTTITTTTATAVEPVFWAASSAVELSGSGASAIGVSALGDSALGRMSYPSRSSGGITGVSTSVGGPQLPQGSPMRGGERPTEEGMAQGESVGRGDAGEESAASGTEGFLDPPGGMQGARGSGGDPGGTAHGAFRGSRGRGSDAGGPGGGRFSSEGSNDVPASAQRSEGGKGGREDPSDASGRGGAAGGVRAAGDGGGSGGSDRWGLVAGDGGGLGGTPRAMVTEVTTLPGCVRLLMEVAVAAPREAAAAEAAVVMGWRRGGKVGAAGKATATGAAEAAVGAGEEGEAAAGSALVAGLQRRLLHAAVTALRDQGLVVVPDGEAPPPLPPALAACRPAAAAKAAGPVGPSARAAPAPAAAVPQPWAPPWQDHLLPLPPVLPLCTGSAPVLAATPFATGATSSACLARRPELQLRPPPLPPMPPASPQQPAAALPVLPANEGLPQEPQRLVVFAPWGCVHGCSLSSLRVAVTASAAAGAPEPPVGCCGSGPGSGAAAWHSSDSGMGPAGGPGARATGGFAALQLPALLADRTFRLLHGMQGVSPSSMGRMATLGGEGFDSNQREQQQGRQRQEPQPVLWHPSVGTFLAATPPHAGVMAAHRATAAAGSSAAQWPVPLAPTTPAQDAPGTAVAHTCTGAAPGPSCRPSGAEQPWRTAGSEVEAQSCATSAQRQQQQQRRAGGCVSVEVVALHVCGEARGGQDDGDGWAEDNKFGSSGSGLAVELAVWDDMQQQQLLPPIQQSAGPIKAPAGGTTAADAAAPRHVYGGAAATPALAAPVPLPQPLPQLHIHLLGYLGTGAHAAGLEVGLGGPQAPREVFLGSVSVPLLPPPAAACLMELWEEQLMDAGGDVAGAFMQLGGCAVGESRGGALWAAAVGQGEEEGREEGWVLEVNRPTEAADASRPPPPQPQPQPLPSPLPTVNSPGTAAGQGAVCRDGGGWGTDVGNAVDAVTAAVEVYGRSFGPLIRDLRLRLQLLAARGARGRHAAGQDLEEEAGVIAWGRGGDRGVWVELGSSDHGAR